MKTASESYICILIIFIAFAWIGLAYIMGTEPERMILNPIVPILLIVLLFSFRGDDSVKRVTTIAIILIGFWLFARLQNVFMPFIIGFALAYIVNVALSDLQKISIPLPKGKRFRISKAIAFAMLATLLIGFLAFLAFGIVPQLVQQATAMREGIISFYNSVKGTVVSLSDMEESEFPFDDQVPESWRPTIRDAIGKIKLYMQEKIPDMAERASEAVAGILMRLSAGLIGTIGQISTAFFILIVFVYAIQSFQSHIGKIVGFVPESKRQEIHRYASEIDTNMRAFLKGQLAVIIIISAISSIAYSIIRVPFALLVGLLAGLSNAIPTIGPVIGGAIAILASTLGFVTGEHSVTGFLIQIALVIGIVFGIQLLDNSLISPRIMSKALDVHPLVVMFAVLLSASLVGIWGAVLAIPGVVVAKAVIKVSGEMRTDFKNSQI